MEKVGIEYIHKMFSFISLYFITIFSICLTLLFFAFANRFLFKIKIFNFTVYFDNKLPIERKILEMAKNPLLIFVELLFAVYSLTKYAQYFYGITLSESLSWFFAVLAGVLFLIIYKKLENTSLFSFFINKLCLIIFLPTLVLFIIFLIPSIFIIPLLSAFVSPFIFVVWYILYFLICFNLFGGRIELAPNKESPF